MIVYKVDSLLRSILGVFLLLIQYLAFITKEFYHCCETTMVRPVCTVNCNSDASFGSGKDLSALKHESNAHDYKELAFTT